MNVRYLNISFGIYGIWHYNEKKKNWYKEDKPIFLGILFMGVPWSVLNYTSPTTEPTEASNCIK